MTITTDTQQLSVNSPQIMPAEPLQYRAVGRVWGRYVPSDELIYKGQLITADGVMLDTKLAKRASKVVQNAQLDLSQDYLWTAYPRTGLKNSLSELSVCLRDFQRINYSKKNKKYVFSRMIIILRGRKGVAEAIPFG
ncbi:hypothetical protein H6G96_33235 [Nostoc sp. FACHB-892]|uniref:hypothetical protein n=1 Tax=Nostoc sp. FACHB-892 TaxID=2692843 RepID=UPI0016884FF2|nr:hypothetical protein [Nostoc sp. FACHB-892]MBD2731050.1 hypothetical protein [Nostoc sp. FACHB-892]